MDIALVHWPADEGKRKRLATNRTPRLLLVAPDVAPPGCDDVLEDWVRLPVSDEDMRARVRALESRIDTAGFHHPSIDESGLIQFHGKRTVLTPLQARLMRCLVDSFGSVVSRDELYEQGWPGAIARRNTLDVHLVRLRARLEALGLRIVTVRSRGFVLQARD